MSRRVRILTQIVLYRQPLNSSFLTAKYCQVCIRSALMLSYSKESPPLQFSHHISQPLFSMVRDAVRLLCPWVLLADRDTTSFSGEVSRTG